MVLDPRSEDALIIVCANLFGTVISDSLSKESGRRGDGESGVCKIEIHCKRQDSCSIIKDVAGHPFSVLEKAKALQKEIWTKEA